MADELFIDPDIRKASTLPGDVYHHPRHFAAQRERLFARAWQPLAGVPDPEAAGDVVPWTLLPGMLDEPLLLARDEAGSLRCLSNVCTHRGNLVADRPARCRTLRCRYHGRRFALDGRFLSMPEFEGVADFPTAADDLRSLPLESWGPWRFTALDPALSFDDWIGPLRDRVGFVPLDELRFDATTSRDYEIAANWALYCDNYLEGFHIPFVHAGLAAALDYGAYTTELFGHSSLQLGIAAAGEPTFELPASHPDRGRNVAAYYFWLFPNVMFNFYPWGLSLNVVEPQGAGATRVRFLTWIWKAELHDTGAGAGLHRVELEDQQVVLGCQRGVRSRLYGRGRYSPEREAGVHHFHRLLAGWMNGSPPR